MRKGRDGGKKRKKREKRGKKTDDYSGHYVIASSRPPDRWNAACSCQLSIKLSFCSLDTTLLVVFRSFRLSGLGKWQELNVLYNHKRNKEFRKTLFSGEEELISVKKKVIHLNSGRISFDRKYTRGASNKNVTKSEIKIKKGVINTKNKIIGAWFATRLMGQEKGV